MSFFSWCFGICKIYIFYINIIYIYIYILLYKINWLLVVGRRLDLHLALKNEIAKVNLSLFVLKTFVYTVKYVRSMIRVCVLYVCII